ncbi:unnamed protein product [Amaranthus hypochondriacus]
MEGFSEIESRSKGAFLTWKDLWVTVTETDEKSRSKSVPILKGITGYAEPGQVLAVMGPSGCGKTLLLDALAGRLRSNTRHNGDILLNGQKQGLAFGSSAYVGQRDILMETLTIREAIHYSALLQLPNSIPKSDKLTRADMVINKMGLEDCRNKIIGGRTLTSISGGQRRRVSICMEIIKRPKLLFLDEPTSGLDSAGSYHVMSYIIKFAEEEGVTVIASIHQPSSEVFELFHKLCLLSYGKLVYFGPVSNANTFFSSNGFPCPIMRNPSDHYLRTINNDFELESQMQERRSETSFMTQSFVLTQRSFINMYRDVGYYRLRLGIYVGICLFLGLLFRGLDDSYASIQARVLMLVFIAGFLAFMAIGGFPSFVEDMKIFHQERLNGYYGVGAFVLSNTISSLPYLFIISFIPGAITYYLSGLRTQFQYFIFFALLLFATMTLVESMMMIVASIVPDFLMGIITGSGIQGVMMLTAGFFRTPNQLIKPIFKYPMHYISFGTYANQGFFKNEFNGLVFHNRDKDHGEQMFKGEDILKNHLQVQVSYSKWFDLSILLGMIMIYRFIFFVIIKGFEIRQKRSYKKR